MTNQLTEREKDLIRKIRAECDHCAFNGNRIAPWMGNSKGVIAVPERYIHAAIEGWQREHGLPIDAPTDA